MGKTVSLRVIDVMLFNVRILTNFHLYGVAKSPHMSSSYTLD